MVSRRQRNDIHRLMRRIKDARDQGRNQEVIKRRTVELYNYLEAEGLVSRNE